MIYLCHLFLRVLRFSVTNFGILPSNLNKYLGLLFNSSRKIIILSITGILIAINWTGFIYSVSIKQVQDASLGYFLTPMISVIFGFFFLNEKLNTNKAFSVMLMFIASLIIVLSQGNFPFISILIGTTWAVYGLLRKQIKVDLIKAKKVK